MPFRRKNAIINYLNFNLFTLSPEAIDRLATGKTSIMISRDLKALAL